MKKLICFFLAISMVVSILSVGIGATPSGYAIRFDESGAYCYFTN